VSLHIKVLSLQAIYSPSARLIMADTTINDGADSDTVNTDAPLPSQLPNHNASSSAHKLARCEAPRILDNGDTKELQDASMEQDPLLAELGMGLQVGNVPPVPLFMVRQALIANFMIQRLT
jgi:hypothetical protein